MKRITIFLLFFITILSLSSCNGNSAHTHDYSSSWETNETHHWKACLEEGCDSIVAISEHSFSEGADLGNGNTKYTCSVCLFEKITHEHRNKEEYSKDENYHWQDCLFDGCDYYGTKIEHSYSEGKLESDGFIHYLCTVCSYEKAEVHNHIFATDFTRTETEHYYECSFEGCYVKNAFAEHSYGTPSFDGEKEIYICAQCGYEDKRTHTHSHTGVLVATEDGHFYSCVLPLCVSKGELLPHDWSEPSLVEGLDVYVCSVCKHTKTQTHEHNSFTDWQSDDNSHWKKCNAYNCNYIEFLASHSWVSDGVIKQPTPNESGEEKFICEVCGLTKIKDIEYIPPKMTEDEWVSYFVFDNLKLKNTYSIGTDEFTDIWLIDGENILITSDESSSYGSVSDLMSFSFLVNCYDSFAVVTEGEYFADEIEYYDSEFEEDVTYKNVRICFSDAKILKIQFNIESGILGTMTEIYDFIEWGGVVVPDNPREIVVPPEAIEEMLGNSLDNFTMVERVTDGEGTYSVVYMFDKNVYSCEAEGEEAIIDSLENAGASFTYYSVGFFYSLNEERFVLNEENSGEDVLVYDYECGITVDGIDYDSISVKLYYEGDSVFEILLSYVVDAFVATSFEYSFTDFGATEVQSPEKALVRKMCGESINQVAVDVNKIIGGTSTYTAYAFDYSDYEYGSSEIGYEYARLKDSAAVFITNWLGTLVEVDASDFVTVSTSDEVKEYKTTVPVVSQGVTYRETEIIVTYYGNAKEGYELASILVMFRKGENGEQTQYSFSEFGNVFIDTQPEEETKEIPNGYMQKFAKEASLLNYTLLVSEKYFIDGEYVDIGSSVIYEFDSHRARYYLENCPEGAEYISEDYVGMAFATELLSVFTKLDDSKYVNMSGKPDGNLTKLYYEYNGTATVDGITLKNICVFLTYRENELVDVSISYSTDIEIESTVSTVDVFYSFYAFGNTVVVFPDDETIVKFGFERFDAQNYEYQTYIIKNGVQEENATGKYDSDKFFEKTYGDEYGNYYYTEHAGLRDFNRFFRPLLNSFSEGELVYSVKENYQGFEYAQIYTGNVMKLIDIQIGKESYRASVSNFRFEFCYDCGELKEVNISYDAVINGEVCQIISYIYGIGEQSIVMPSERDFSFDPDNTDELCGNSLDNYILYESVTKDGNVISSFTGQFEKDYAKYNAMSGTAVTENFNGKADGKGKSFASEKIGFLYGLNTENFECIGAYENNVVYKYTKTVTLSSDEITSLTVTLTFSADDIDKVDSVIIEYIRTSAGVKSTYEVTLSNFGKVSLVRPDQPNENALPEYLYNAMIDPQDTETATLETKKVGQNGEEYGYASYDDSYDIAGEYYVGGEGTETYTTFEEAKAAYEEHFAPFIDLLEAITPSRLIYNESAGMYMLSGRITYNDYKITTANVEVLQDDRVYIHVFIYGNNNTGVFTLDLRITMKVA